MIVSAARLHGQASSRRRLYMAGGGNDNQPIVVGAGLIDPRPLFVLTRFLHANRYPLRLKTPWGLHNPRRDLAAQPLQTEQRVGAGFRDFDPLGRKMLAEEIAMRCAFVE